MVLRYMGNGPYCAANSLSVIFDSTVPESGGPGSATIEVLSGTPFGIAIHGDNLTYFTPPGWSPEYGITTAMKLLGWECDRTCGSQEESVAILRKATRDRPVLVGQIEMGLLPYVPGIGQAIGADHNIVVIGMEGDMVRAHDVQGWPFVTVPLDALIACWQGNTFAYPADAYALRWNFRQVRKVHPHDALRASIPGVIDLLDAAAIADAAGRAAKLIESGLTNMQYKYLVEFTVQGGARRLADAAVLYDEIGCHRAAEILDRQGMLVGSLQLSLVTHDNSAAATTFRELAPTYGQLREELIKEVGS
jgi:hypothetical protein